MNENPGETPNPLNPNPVMSQPNPVSAPAQQVSGNMTSTVAVESLAPTGRPMEQAAPATLPVKKKKTGLIAGIIAAAAVLLIGGVAAAIVLINLNKTDPVTAAMNKIMSGNAPANVAIDGDINIAINDQFSPISNVKITLNSGLITSSMINNSSAKVTATIRNVGDLSIDFDEVYAGNGDLYFKIDGAQSALEESGLLYLLNLSGQLPAEVDCGDDGYCQTTELEEILCTDEECEGLEINDTELNVLGDGAQNMLNSDTIEYFASMLEIVDVIDGEWLRVSVDELNVLNEGLVAESDISCITNLVSDINTNSNSSAELYSKYPFITSTNENVSIESKDYPVYQVVVDSENFANYVNSIQNSEMTANLYSCLNWSDNVRISGEDVAEIVNDFPTIYADVDNDYNFTRLYLASSLNDDKVTLTIDLGFSYPTNVNVPEPVEYTDFSDVLQEVFSSMYDLPVDN